MSVLCFLSLLRSLHLDGMECAYIPHLALCFSFLRFFPHPSLPYILGYILFAWSKKKRIQELVGFVFALVGSYRHEE